MLKIAFFAPLNSQRLHTNDLKKQPFFSSFIFLSCLLTTLYECPQVPFTLPVISSILICPIKYLKCAIYRSLGFIR